MLVGTIEVVALGALVGFVTVKRDRGFGEISETASSRTAFWGTLRAQYRILATAGSGQVFAQMIRAGRGLILPLYAAEVIGLDLKAIGMIISLAAAIDMLLFYPTGIIMDRYGRKFSIIQV